MNDAGRKKIGLLVPSSNTTVEYDFRRSVPPQVSLHGARLWLRVRRPTPAPPPSTRSG